MGIIVKTVVQILYKVQKTPQTWMSITKENGRHNNNDNSYQLERTKSRKIKPCNPTESYFSALLSSFCSIKQLRVILLPLDGMLVHRMLLPSILPGCPNNLPVPRVKCFTQQHDTMTIARAWTQNIGSRVQQTNHLATVPPEGRGLNNNKNCWLSAQMWAACNE